MESLKTYFMNIMENDYPKSKQKTPVVLSSDITKHIITYRPGLFGNNWDKFSKERHYPESYNEATFKFDLDNNSIEVECPNPRNTKMTHYCFKLKHGTFNNYNSKDMVITPQDLNPYMSKRTDISIPQMIDMLDIACWAYNWKPQGWPAQPF